MTNNISVKFWNDLTETQSENINGGYSYRPISVIIGGGVGALQINAGDGGQVNFAPTGYGPAYVSYYGYYHH